MEACVSATRQHRARAERCAQNEVLSMHIFERTGLLHGNFLNSTENRAPALFLRRSETTTVNVQSPPHCWERVLPKKYKSAPNRYVPLQMPGARRPLRFSILQLNPSESRASMPALPGRETSAVEFSNSSTVE